MNEKEIKEIEQRLMANTFYKKNIVITRGRGALVWDINGKEYIDCTAAYGVANIGHSHPRVVEAIKRQAEALISCHGSIYNDARSELLQKIVDITPDGLSKAYLGNSGAEAIECAIKLARKYTGKPEIVAMMGGFHGKTGGALSATWEKKYRTPFEPLLPGFRHVPYGRSERAKEVITEKTAAVLVEPVQGEGGIRVPPEGFLSDLREMCDGENVLLIIDEVQTGFGRTGKLFACEHWNVTPDIMCMAKAVAGGVPMGITIAREDIMASFKTGEHTSTFGGNPLACAAACAAIDVIVEEGLPEKAAKLGAYLMRKLERLRSRYKIVREVRGLGLMQAMEFRFDILSIILKNVERGVLYLDAGRNVLRFLPPLVITKEQIDRMVAILEGVVEEEERERIPSPPPG
ncbi:MAG: aspartate aminotransferase family protein [Candidatus Bathyarchaeia archaeon]